MKEIKIVAIAVIITIAIILSCACAMPACAEERNKDYGEFYPRLTIVVEVKSGIVICQDKEGNLWAFFSDEDDWTAGDICNILMWNTSEDVTKHEVVEVYWEGYIEYIDEFFQMEGWR